MKGLLLLIALVALGCDQDTASLPADGPPDTPPHVVSFEEPEVIDVGTSTSGVTAVPLCSFSCSPGTQACGCLGDFRAGCTSANQYCWDGRITHCAGSESPSSVGPRCCQGRALARPHQNLCHRFNNFSPRFSTHGTYLAHQDPNFLATGSDVLEVLGLRVHDNGEGNNWPHGPYGNLYIDFFPCTEPLDRVPDGANRRRIGRRIELRGPHRTGDATDEWLDDEAMFYKGAGVFAWQPNQQCVTVRVTESDGSEDGSWGRRDDVLCLERIHRNDTTRQAHLVNCVKYTNDHPRRRQPTVRTMWLWVYTK